MVEAKLSTSTHWDQRANAGYQQLGWVTNNGLLNKIVELAHLEGGELVVDAGTGSGAVLDALSPHLNKQGIIIGFDVSRIMMAARTTPLPDNAQLLVGSIYNIPISDQAVDVVTVRQVIHNLSDITTAVREVARILRSEGKAIFCEYTPQDQEVLDFERPVWELKEPGRNLWTGEQLVTAIAGGWIGQPKAISLYHEVLMQYSTRNWLRNSGLPFVSQEAIESIYWNAPLRLKRKMGITVTTEGDTLIDRPWAYVVVTN